jgi:pimeloyl-ACP methyl ester carboxylesterase
MMAQRSFDVRIETGTLSDGRSWSLAATVHLPAAAHGAEQMPVVVCLPGGGYNRRYFDLQEPGYSEARHHTDRGAVVIAIDHLRVGESDIPDLADASLEIAAEANDAVLRIILERLAGGTLHQAVEPLRPCAIIGEGQSMGGHIALLMQAQHRSFDGLAMLGSSAVCTRLPARVSGEEICLLGKDDPAEGLATLRTFDKRFAFHWEDVPERYAGADDRASASAYWLSATTPNAGVGLLPGHFASKAATVTSPVLVGMGERDVCQDPLREVAAYMSSRDVSYIVVPRMAHMHNFAGTRAIMWKRLSAFIAQVADMGSDR